MTETHRRQPEAHEARTPIAAMAVHYIKLGGGAFASDCLERGEIGLAFEFVSHALAEPAQNCSVH